MIHSPAVLILDEPANGLDPRARIELRQMIQQLAVDGTTILVSSHILTELAEMCDQVGIIERGRLLAVGSVAEIRRTLQGALRVEITALDRSDQLHAWLASQAGVSKVRREANKLTFDLEGGPADQVALLKAIISADFSILEFAAHRETLEDVFMKITTGAVQ
jgi:ABC-2 type transport system ATP-binding protein